MDKQNDVRCTNSLNSKRHLPGFTGGGSGRIAYDVKPIAELTERRGGTSSLAVQRGGDHCVARSFRDQIFLVDDHPLFRAGIRQSLAPYMEFCIVGEAGNARDAFVAIETHRPDIVVMDVALPGMDGVIATREIRRRTPRTRVLIFSVHDQIGDVLDALDAGASGYALKTEGTDALVAALRCVLRNDRYVAPSLATRLASYESRRTSRRTRCRFCRCANARSFDWPPTAC